jgi:hypothetical protein
MRLIRFAAPVCLLLLSACAATPEPERVTGAALTPLNDLNVVKAPIPPVLLEAKRDAYAMPVGKDCNALRADVRALDEVLGADLDTPVTAKNPSLIERGGTAVGDAAVGAVKRTAEGVIPFRSWVRKLTGAERYSRDVAAAIAAGTVRRAFLKGHIAARACEVPPVQASTDAAVAAPAAPASAVTR